jgi:hypothetical protein
MSRFATATSKWANGEIERRLIFVEFLDNTARSHPRYRPLTEICFTTRNNMGGMRVLEIMLSSIDLALYYDISAQFPYRALVVRHAECSPPQYEIGFRNSIGYRDNDGTRFELSSVFGFFERSKQTYDAALVFSSQPTGCLRFPIMPLMFCQGCERYTPEWVREMYGPKRSVYLPGVYCLACRCLYHAGSWLSKTTDYAKADLNPAWLQYSAIMEGVVQERGLVADVRHKIMEFVAASFDQ